jgi:hypothetical protein
MRGVVEVPIQQGKKELAWYVGQAVVNGTNGVSPVIPLSISRDADFMAKRMWLVQWPTYAASLDASLAFPAQATFLPRDPQTKRALSLVAAPPSLIYPNADPARQTEEWIGLPCPYLIRANTSLTGEVQNPGAAGTPWVGDLFWVAEGYKVYPYLPEEIPAKIKSYAVPYSLNGNMALQNPNSAASNIQGQVMTINNAGDGKFLAKGMRIKIVDSAGADKTAAVLPCLGLQISDTTSGNKNWVTNNTPGVNQMVPASILTLGGTGLYWNTPRYIDPMGAVSFNIFFSNIAAAIAYLNGLGNWPMTLSISLVGTLLPA